MGIPKSQISLTLVLTMGIVYKQPLRQTQGLLRSVAELMALRFRCPTFYSVASRQRAGFASKAPPVG